MKKTTKRLIALMSAVCLAVTCAAGASAKSERHYVNGRQYTISIIDLDYHTNFEASTFAGWSIASEGGTVGVQANYKKNSVYLNDPWIYNDVGMSKVTYQCRHDSMTQRYSNHSATYGGVSDYVYNYNLW